MNLWQKISAAWQTLRGYNDTGFARGDDLYDRTPARVTDPFVQVGAVYACIEKIAKTLGQIEFKLSRGQRKGEALIEAGPLYHLFQQPHRRLNRVEFIELLIQQLYIRGENFLIALDRAGEPLDVTLLTGRQAKAPTQLVPLRPDLMRHDVQHTVLLGWDYHAGPDAIWPAQYFAPAQVLQAKLTHPYDIWRGLCPLIAAALPSATDHAAALFYQGLMIGNGETQPAWRTEQQLNDQQLEQVRAQIQSARRFAGTPDATMVLPAGLTREKPSFSTVEMEFLAARKYTRREICMILGVPEIVLGWIEDANRSEGQNQQKDFFFNTICPVAEKLEALLDPIVKSAGPDVYGWFDLEAHPIMRQHRAEQAETAARYWQMGVPFEDINNLFDLGFPARPQHRHGYLPLNLNVAASVSEQPDHPTDPPDPTPESASARIVRALEKIGKQKAESSKQQAESRAHAQRATRAEAWAAAIEPAIRTLRNRLRRFFFTQRARVLQALESTESTKSTPSTAAEDRRGVLRHSPAQRAEGAEALTQSVFDLNLENTLLLDHLRADLIGNLELGGLQIWEELNLSGEFALPSDRATAYFAQRTNALRGINNTTFEEIREALQEAEAAGEPAAERNRRIRKIFNHASDVRADTIAATETSTAVNNGRLTAMQEAGIRLKAWLPSPVEHSRPHHLAAGSATAQGIPLDQPFLVGGERLMHPGDTSHGATIGNTINCRCHLIAVAPSESPEDLSAPDTPET